MEKRKNDPRKQLSLILADKLKELRKSRAWSLSQLSIEVDEMVTPQALGLYEKGMRMPSVEVVTKLAEVYKIDKSELIECRAHAILETCMLLGEDTPPSIRNERNMLVHGQQHSSGTAFIELEMPAEKLIHLVYQASQIIQNITLPKGDDAILNLNFEESRKELEVLTAKIRALSDVEMHVK